MKDEKSPHEKGIERFLREVLENFHVHTNGGCEPVYICKQCNKVTLKNCPISIRDFDTKRVLKKYLFPICQTPGCPNAGASSEHGAN